MFVLQVKMASPSKRRKTAVEELPKCSFSAYRNTKCHSSSLKPDLKSFSNLDNEVQTVFKMRAGIMVSDQSVETICLYHEKILGEWFEERFTKCCDIFKRHKTKKKPNGRTKLKLDTVNKLRDRGYQAVPGWKLCNQCNQHVKLVCTTSSDESDNNLELTESIYRENMQDKLNKSLNVFSISPVKTHSLAKSTKANINLDKIRRNFQEQRDAAIRVLRLGDPDSSATTSSEAKMKADMEILLSRIKTKLEGELTFAEKVQLMTLAPASWSRKEVSDYFDVSEYTVREARTLIREKGIIAVPDARKGRTLAEEIRKSVEKFYEDDEFSRLMPGAKDFISIGKNNHVQKRLLLSNLKELHAAYKEKYPHHKIGISKFCELRPIWCITVTSSGAHSVCVCSIHQNAKLLVDSFCSTINEQESSNIKITYKDLMEKIVCRTDEIKCMLQRCENCPGSRTLHTFIMEKFTEAGFYITDDVHYSQWVSTDRADLDRITSTIEKFTKRLVDSIDNLTTHSFVAKNQAQYLKTRKAEMEETECVVIMDFAENYHYQVQDEIQGFHWNKRQCTLHPIVVYFKEGNMEKHLSFCAISDDTTHDTSLVHEIQKRLCFHLKEKLPGVRKVEYFSDGCAGQYKNYKNFLNLCHHESDFGLKATWSFFATSHGKSPCDGIGGTVKRKILRSSLQRPVDNQLLTFDAIQKFCESNFDNLIFIVIHEETMVHVRDKLKARYSLGGTVPGTRNCHHFEPISKSSIRGKRVSKDTAYSIQHSFAELPIQNVVVTSLKVNDYVTCVFDGFWWLAMIVSINTQEEDCTCTFMHPHGPSDVFHWPQNDDMGYVPFSKIIMKIETPAASSNGRKYFIKKEEKEQTILHFEKL